MPASPSPLSEADRVHVLEQLAREHKLLRDKVVEMTRFAEGAVARAVVAENHVRNLQADLADCRAHVEALLGSRTMRMVAPARRAYALARRTVGRR